MKWFLGIISCVGLALIFILCPTLQKSEAEYLRIHIRANSNSQADQAVKYLVKDGVVEALIPILSEVETFEEAKIKVQENFSLIENVANEVLKECGFSYKSDASLTREYFPTRTYDQLTLEEGEYDALILNLGSGEGNNWWCLVYPAFCFTSSTNSDNVEYISKIWEIIKNITREE
ncbi:MAG: stage II sporulation protein R [Clostridia bacterium]|nr:stage II sporulation protein R [Clostridia bacterium]MBQ8792550.1 stage II sporulation protein R [Clostridia bacterium]